MVISLRTRLQSEEGILSLRYPFVIISKDETFTIAKNDTTLLHCCNHEGAATRLVIVASDTDVLILMISVHHTHNLT